MVRLALSVLREIIWCPIFVSAPVRMTIMEHPVTAKSALKIIFEQLILDSSLL